jgi:hypothetical protein
MQALYCHSCMLPNVMAGIILWLVMSPSFSSVHDHVGCGLCREMMWPQNWDLIFKAKFIFRIIWNPSGFYVVDRLSNDTKMNSAYFVTNILTPLEQAIFPRWRVSHQKKFVIHLNNCSVHTSRASRDWLEEDDMRRMPQPFYSFHLISSDFYLFPTVKEKLERTQVADKDQFLNRCKRFWGV